MDGTPAVEKHAGIQNAFLDPSPPASGLVFEAMFRLALENFEAEPGPTIIL